MPASPSPADRNLLFGILALQMDFITRDQLIAGMHAWVLEKGKPLGRILVEQKALREDLHTALDVMVQKHLEVHGNDAQKSLAALSSASAVRRDLKPIADDEVQASLGHVGSARDLEDDIRTRGPETVGFRTAEGTRFRILRPHAKGGLGEVFVARDEELGREVALKRIQAHQADDGAARTRFLVEAEITGGLEHPGIVPVYGLGAYADGRPFYAMRFIRGDSLKEAIERFHKKSSADFADYADKNRSAISKSAKSAKSADQFSGLEFRQLLGRFVDVCNAIAYAHSRGVLHRDLKPGNIMLGPYGETLVVDWGLAKTGAAGQGSEIGAEKIRIHETALQPASGSDVVPTLAGQALGTPQYMSPEQAAGRLDQLGPGSDVYSLGATLYCLLTGHDPFDERDIGELLRRVQRGEFVRPRQRRPELPAALEAICQKAMALDPKNRYISPLDLAADIEHWLADELVGAYGEPWAVRAGRWARKHKPLVSGVAAALLVGLIALTTFAFWDASHQAEAARKQALAEEKVRQGLDQARHTRAELHKILKQPGGVQELLNQPARWQAQIKSARADWQRANDVVTNAEGTLDPEWTTQLKTVDEEIARDQADYELALRLEKIRLDKSTWSEGKFDYSPAERDYPDAFRQAGFGIAPGRQKEVARRIRQSPIKDQLLAALDDWALVAAVNKNPDLSSRLLEVARLVDPDPWRDQVRDPSLRNNGTAMVKLAEDVQTDRKFMARLSPQMLLLVSDSLPEGKTKESWLRTAQALHPADFWISFDLAYSLYREKEPREAAAFNRVAAAIRPNNAAAYNNLGLALYDQKDLPAAIDAYKKALAIDPKLAFAWNNLGNVLHHQNDLREAFEACKKALAIDPKLAEAWNSLGNHLSHQKDLPAAIDAYNKALAIDPKHAGAWCNLGIALRDKNDLPAAIDAYNKALAIDPKDALAWNNLGYALAGQKDLPAAIDAFKKALAIEPKNAAAWNNLGTALSDQKDLPAAIDAYKKALAIEPKHARAWNSLGNHLSHQKDLPAAIDAYKKALAIEPKFAYAWNNLGTALHDQNDLPAAIDAYHKALAIDPKYAFAWNNLGIALYAQKDLPAAIDAHKKALAIDPKYAIAWYNLGLALRDKNDLPSAINAYEKAIDLKADYAEAHCNLGLVLRDQGDFVAACKALKEGHRLGTLRKGWPYPSAAWVKECQGLLALENRLPGVLQGDDAASVPVQLALADLCQRYKKRYRDATQLYAKAFVAEPKSAEDLGKNYRYHAACAAALAAAGKGVDADKLEAKEQTRLRKQALDWLQKDWAARAKLLEKNPLAAAHIHDDMRHWQRDADLAGLRDDTELAKLPADERAAWTKLWDDVERLGKAARSSYTQTEHKGQLGAKEREQSYPIKMTAGKTYVIDLESKDFDTFLKLQDAQGKQLAENDDIEDGKILNSRLIFTPPAAGVYRIIATSFEQRGAGAYTLRLREFK